MVSRPAKVGLVHLQGRARQPVEPVGDAGQVRAPRLGQAHAARQAPEQGEAQARLQPLDVLADRARRHAQLRRRLHEIAVAGGGFEGAQGGQRRQRSAWRPEG